MRFVLYSGACGALRLMAHLQPSSCRDASSLPNPSFPNCLLLVHHRALDRIEDFIQALTEVFGEET